MSEPVRFVVPSPPLPRSRVTALLRPVLALPHVLLVGGPPFFLMSRDFPIGVLGALAALCAVFDWLSILFRGRAITGLATWKGVYLRWRARTLAYCALLRDEYPPFDDAAYPATLVLPEPPAARDRVQVLLRPLLALPHLVLLVVLGLVWLVSVFVSWLAIVIFGQHPAALWRLGRDIAGYSLRVEAYLLLVHDSFPRFALGEGVGGEEPADRDRGSMPSESLA